MSINFLNLIKKCYDWTNWKLIAEKKALILQYDQDDIKYTVYGYDGSEVHVCFIWLDSVPPAIAESYIQTQNDADKTDFETNWKPTGNQQIAIPRDSDGTPKQKSKAFADSDGFRVRFKGISGTATKNTTTNIDYKLTEERYIDGVQLILKNQTIDDYIKFQIVDVDNILGYGAGAVLDEFGSTWNIVEDRQEQGVIKVAYPAKIIANLYIRVVYVSIGTELDVKVKANIFLHKKT